MIPNTCSNCKKQKDNLITEFEDMFCDYGCLVEFHTFLQMRKEKKWEMKITHCSYCSQDIDRYHHHTFYVDYVYNYFCNLECKIKWMKQVDIKDDWLEKNSQTGPKYIKEIFKDITILEKYLDTKTAISIVSDKINKTHV